MAFNSPIPIAVPAFRAQTALFHPRQRAIVMLIVIFFSAAAARAETAVDSELLPTTATENNPWQQLTDWFAGPPAPPLRFGTVCGQVVQSSTIPAALAGPVAGPIPEALARCDVLDETRSERASTTTGEEPEPVTLLKGLPWRMGYTGTPAAQSFATPNALTSADFASRKEVGLVTWATVSMSPEGCSQAAGCETRAPDRADLRPAASLAHAAPRQTPGRWAAPVILSFLWLALLAFVAACVFAGGWLVRRWFRYDRVVLRAARAGLRRGEFHVEYQPVVAVRRTRCVGVEALVRWDNPKYGALGPGHYMPFIESSSLIGPLTRFVMSRAAHELREIGAPKSLYLGVSAPSSYLLSSGFMADLEDIGSSGLPPFMLKIAVSSAQKFSKRLIPMMTLARERDVRFALSGVRPADCAFELPQDMTFEMVKVDRAVLGLDPDERAGHLNALTRMGHDLGAVVVIEGVENVVHHNVARKSHAEFGQGFFYSRALGAIRLKDFLEVTNAPHSRTGGAAMVRGWRIRTY